MSTPQDFVVKLLEMETRSKTVPGFFVGSYVVLRMAGDPLIWSQCSEYYSYFFEFGFSVLAFLYFRKQIRIWSLKTKEDSVAGFLAFVSGAGAFSIAHAMQIAVPFDFSSSETAFLILIVGPLLEEALFRMALWEPLRVLLGRDSLVLAATTLLFALAHLLALWFVPEEFRTFVLYQSAYVLVLGAAAGWRRQRSEALLPAVLVHFFFNLGFFEAAKMS